MPCFGPTSNTAVPQRSDRRVRTRRGDTPRWPLGVVFAAYLVGRGVVELFQIDYSDPASYQNAWGGPHLSGVLAVHTGPGLAIVVATVVIVMRRHRSRSSGLTVVRRPPRQPNTH